MKCDGIAVKENSCIFIDSDRITDINEGFSALTGYLYKDVRDLSSEAVLTSLLKIGHNDLEQMMTHHTASCFIFTKTGMPREVSLTVHTTGPDAYGIEIKEKTDFRLENQIAFVEQMFHDDFMCAAIYSVPDFVLLKANRSYLKLVDDEDPESAASVGKRVNAFGLFGSLILEYLNRVVDTKENLHIEEKLISGANGETFRNFTFIPVFNGNELKFIYETSKDVTERVRARLLKESQDIEIRQSKEKLEAIVDNMSDQLMIIRKDGHFELFNKAAKELFDPIYGATDRLGGSQRKAEYYDMDNKKLTTQDLPAWTVLQGKKADGFRFKIKHTDWTVIEVNGTSVYDDNGDILYGILCCRDITDLVNYEEKLIEQNNLLTAIIENMHDAIAVFDSDGKISLLNAEARHLYPHYDKRTSVSTVHDGYDCFDLEHRHIPVDDLPTRRAFRGETVRNERIIIQESRRKRITEINATPIFDKKMNFISSVVSHHDITENFRYQEQINRKNEQLQKKNIQLRGFAEKLRSIVENADDYILSIDTHDNIVMLNASAKHYYSLSYNEELKSGVNLSEIRHPVLRSRLTELCKKALRDGKFQIDVRAYNSNIVVTYTVNPVYINNKVVEVILFGKDMTERIKAENQIVKMNNLLENLVQVRTTELQNSVKELQDFSMAVSHEMKTPLREIEYNIRDILENHNVAQNGGRILKICNEKTEMIDKLLKFSLSTKKEMNKEMLNIKRMIVSTFESIKENMNVENAVLAFETGFPHVSADKLLLQQALTNIISNALKFSSLKKIPQLIVGCKEENREYIFYFKDNGVGFNMEYVGKLFGVFERLHPGNVFEGSGIGLAIVRKIIMRHGGRIWIEGEENVGAVLSFTLPI